MKDSVSILKRLSKNYDKELGDLISSNVEPLRPLPEEDEIRMGPYWEFDHYEPKPGKIVGVWPGSGISFLELKNRWGFSGILVGMNNYNEAISVGFSVNNIMMAIPQFNLEVFGYIVRNYPAGYYTLGEGAVNHDCNTVPYGWEYLRRFSDTVHIIRPTSKIVIDGYKRCNHMRDALDPNKGNVDKVMYSSYKNWFRNFCPAWTY